MTTIRLLHISDLHFSTLPAPLRFPALLRGGLHRLFVRAHSPTLGEGLARWLYENGDDIDGIVATGDLATTGRPDDLRAAHRFLCEPPGDEGRWLTAKGEPVIGQFRNENRLFLVPGNHDRFDGLLMKPAGRHFDRVFGTEWRARQSAQTCGVLASNGKAVLLIGLDLSLTTSADASTDAGGAHGQGRAYDRVLQRAIQLSASGRKRLVAEGLVGSGDDDVALLWLIHFPPDFRPLAKALELVDDAELIGAGDRAGVTGFLAGHTHEAQVYRVGRNGAKVACASSALQYEEGRNSIQTVDIEFGAAGVRLDVSVLRWDGVAFA